MKKGLKCEGEQNSRFLLSKKPFKIKQLMETKEINLKSFHQA